MKNIIKERLTVDQTDIHSKTNRLPFLRKLSYFLLVLGTLIGLFVYSCLKDYTTLLQFRTTLSPYDWWTVMGSSDLPDRAGLDTLNMSGSGVIHENAIRHSFKDIPVSSDKIYVINLTTVDQLYANGRPFRWFNWKQNPDAPGEVKQPYYAINKFKLNRLIRIKDNAKWYLRRHYYPKLQDSFIESEEQMINRMGYHYASFYVNRREVFPPETIDQFLEFVRKLPVDAWLHFHCDGGNSRTTTLMIFYDIIKNGKQIPLQVIVERQHALGGVDINDVQPRKGGTWKIKNLIMRKNLVNDFYRYVNDEKGYGLTKWSEWFAVNGTAKDAKTDDPEGVL